MAVASDIRTGMRVDRATLAAFIGAVFIGGGNFLAVRFSNEDLAPLYGAAVRFGAAALVFFAVAAALRLPLPRGRALWGAVAYGSLGFGAGYALLYKALVGLPAGTTSVVMAAVPLVTLALAVAHRQERFSTRGVVGGILAVAGIALIARDGGGGNLEIGYLLAAVGAVVATAESAVVVKGFPRSHPVTTNAVGMAAGTVLLVLASSISGESWSIPDAGRTWLVLLWLVAAGSVGLFMLFLYVIARWTASASAYAITMMPVVAVTLGAVFADEAVTVALVIGALLVVAAVYVGALGRTEAPVAEEPVALVADAEPAAAE